MEGVGVPGGEGPTHFQAGQGPIKAHLEVAQQDGDLRARGDQHDHDELMSPKKAWWNVVAILFLLRVI